MIRYSVLISHAVLSLPRPSARQQQIIFEFLESLANNPFQKGDFEEADQVGRIVQVKVLGSFALAFWADHAVREVKVIRFEKADGM